MKLSTYLSALRKCERETESYSLSAWKPDRKFISSRIELSNKLERKILSIEKDYQELITKLHRERK